MKLFFLPGLCSCTKDETMRCPEPETEVPDNGLTSTGSEPGATELQKVVAKKTF